MIGIDKKPFIDCSPYIDLAGIENLEKEICFGIARSNVQAGIYGPGLRDIDDRKSFVTLNGEYRLNKQEDLPKLLSLSRNQRSLFFKLYEGLYNASTTVYLRDIKDKSDIPNIKDYFDKDSSKKTDWTSDIVNFPNLKKWIEKLPFEEIGRVLFFIHEHDCELLVHRDGTNYKPHNTEFLWINPCMIKKFYVWNEETDERHYVDTPVAFFNPLDFHGGDPVNRMTWSLRVDGKFTQKFKETIGIDHLEHY